jgi:hypothetical protein
MELDIYLHVHLSSLMKQIRERAFCLYFVPYASVSLFKMADAFKITVNDLEQELAHLITKGVLSVRIDSHEQVMVIL